MRQNYEMFCRSVNQYNTIFQSYFDGELYIPVIRLTYAAYGPYDTVCFKRYLYASMQNNLCIDCLFFVYRGLSNLHVELILCKASAILLRLNPEPLPVLTSLIEAHLCDDNNHKD